MARTGNKRNMKTLRAQWLGQQLRELRNHNQLTLKEAAEYLQRNFSALSRYELGEWPIRRGDMLALLDLYGVNDERERKRLIELAEEVWRTDQWEYGDIVDHTFIDYPWLESRAERICAYDSMYVLGLLQTKEYAEVVIRTAEGEEATDKAISRYVELRMERQRVIEGDKPTRVDAILDEAVLRRRVGGPQVMRDQLAHLATLARQRHVTIRVVPFAIGAHAGFDGAFRFFEMPKPYPEVAYLESLGGRLYLESPKTERFVRAYDRLRQVALDPVASVRRITDIAEAFDG